MTDQLTCKAKNLSNWSNFEWMNERKFVGLFSGGKDSLTACHYLWRAGKLDEVIYCKTGVGLNFDYVLEICNKFGWKLNLIEPKEGETYEDYIRKYGFPHNMNHLGVMSFLKWRPMKRFWKERNKTEPILFISGRRKNESKRRKHMKSNQEYNKAEGMEFWSPIFDWSTEEVWNYIRENNLQASPIYKTMHISGDCFCGAFMPKGSAQLLYVFHKELAERFIELEKKYGGKWGNYTSMTGLSKQTKLTDIVCSECFFDSNIETEVPLPLIRGVTKE